MREPATKRGVLAGFHILIVEDDFDGREILQLLLTYFGGRVTPAANARQALGILAHVEPDLVLTDMVLSGRREDGLWLIKEARDRGSKAPFIAVSGQYYDERQLRQSGFAAYLRKPLDHERLLGTILTVAKP